jgi:hypothetical protein
MALDIAPREPDSQRTRRIDMRALWRVAGWGGAAAVALGALVFTIETHTGYERLKLAFAPVETPIHAVAVVKVPPSPPANDAEMARLEEQVQALAADRDRLTERIASLEHSLDDLTGSIRRLTSPLPPTAATEPPPKASSPEVTAADTPHSPSEAAASEPEAAQPPQHVPSRTLPAPPVPHTSQVIAPAAVPLPPMRVAALPPKPEFGISLAGATSVDLLRMQWAAAKANFGPLLGDLKPHAVHERRGTASHYRLVLGPLPTYIAAAKLCARLIAAHAICHPVRMAGEPM